MTWVFRAAYILAIIFAGWSYARSRSVRIDVVERYNESFPRGDRKLRQGNSDEILKLSDIQERDEETREKNMKLSEFNIYMIKSVTKASASGETCALILLVVSSLGLYQSFRSNRNKNITKQSFPAGAD